MYLLELSIKPNKYRRNPCPACCSLWIFSGDVIGYLTNHGPVSVAVFVAPQIWVNVYFEVCLVNVTLRFA